MCITAGATRRRRRTRPVRPRPLTGWHWGGGVFFNYLFLASWTADVAWWWASPTSFRRRPWWLDAAVRAFLWFLFVNGAFVFVRGPARWLGLLAAAMVAATWYRGRGRGAGNNG